MNKVITINLNNNAYQIDEAGYAALKSYLEKAEATLADNPDKEEIMGDFEQAIADKCDTYLSADKTVVTSQEVETILKEMGPVKDIDGQEDDTKEGRPTSGPKRLYKIRQGAFFEGVCNGLAAYFDVDPMVMRAIFIILTILTSGGFIFAYILLAIFLPEARTAEDRAAARGVAFNAQSFIADTSAKYQAWKDSGYKDGKVWSDYGKKWEEYGKRQGQYWKAEAKRMKQGAAGREVAKGWRGLCTFFAVLASLIAAGLSLGYSLGIVSIINSGQIAGYFSGTPKWHLLAFFTSVFLLAIIPFAGLAADLARVGDNRSRMHWIWDVFMYIVWFAAATFAVALVSSHPTLQAGLQQLINDIGAFFNR